MCPENENGRPTPPVFKTSSAELDNPTAGIKATSATAMTTVPIFATPFAGNRTPDDQRGKADRIIPVTMLQVSTINTAVTGPAIASTEISKIDFRHVTQHQQTDAYAEARRGGCVNRDEMKAAKSRISKTARPR